MVVVHNTNVVKRGLVIKFAVNVIVDQVDFWQEEI
jgi:hypothetical protein